MFIIAELLFLKKINKVPLKFDKSAPGCINGLKQCCFTKTGLINTVPAHKRAPLPAKSQAEIYFFFNALALGLKDKASDSQYSRSFCITEMAAVKLKK